MSPAGEGQGTGPLGRQGQGRGTGEVGEAGVRWAEVLGRVRQLHSRSTRRTCAGTLTCAGTRHYPCLLLVLPRLTHDLSASWRVPATAVWKQEGAGQAHPPRDSHPLDSPSPWVPTPGLRPLCCPTFEHGVKALEWSQGPSSSLTCWATRGHGADSQFPAHSAKARWATRLKIP